MKIILLFDKLITKIKRSYRNRLFYEKTGQRANLIGDIILINKNLKIGKNVNIYPNVQIFGDGLIEIGDNVDIGTGTIIYSSKFGGIHIGSNSLIAGQCYLIDTDHGIEGNDLIKNQKNTSSPIFIGEDVWIAAQCMILKGSRIKNGAIVGAKSLVKGEIEKNNICVGIPVKVLKSRTQSNNV